MEELLAIIASLFAIIQGGVWLIHGIQRYRAKKFLEASGSDGFQSTGDSRQGDATLYGTVGSRTPSISTFHTDAMPERMLASSALRSVGSTFVQPTGSATTSNYPNDVTTPEEVVEYWQTQSRFRRLARGIWHAILIAFFASVRFSFSLGTSNNRVVSFPEIGTGSNLV